MTGTSFHVWRADSLEETEEWISLWEAWPQREVFAHPNYVRLYADTRKSRALCAVFLSEHGHVLYPFILRDLTAEPFWNPSIGPASDIVSPYGYSGPFTWGNLNVQDLAGVFWKQFDDWASCQNIVSEFVRFALLRDTLLPYPGERTAVLQNVVCDLTSNEETLWMSFKHKVRKNVKKAQRSNVHVEIDPVGKRLDDFLRIYNGTLARRQARNTYYFPRPFFEHVQQDLPGQFVYFHAVHEGRVISTELVLVSAENVYSFLGGSDSSTFDLRPNDLLKYEVILWAKSCRKRRFILGGGYEPADGIYRYKLSFAPDGDQPYFVGHRILHTGMYSRLVASKTTLMRSQRPEWSPRPDFFPAYRSD